jgi:hypothetical protein
LTLLGLGLFWRRRRGAAALLVVIAAGALATSVAQADPCGMVPPIYTGPGQPITRVGDQITYVFYKDGVESFVIRPGFTGKVDEFGMLVPFPTVPSMRKVPDHVFAHIQAAIDPPEVVIDLIPKPQAAAFGGRGGGGFPANKQADGLAWRDKVVVLKQEAIGMYEVAVLEAGSAAALKRWMDDHGFKYPEGMDDVCEQYIEMGWCFVAEKTKVGQKKGVDPEAGQREVQHKLPDGSTFDGYVQGMEFRFPSKELIVPMRLGTYNDGDLHNIVYLFTDKPQKIRSIPEEYVVRQLSGLQLFKNVTDPLPLRIIGGTEADLTDWHRKNLPAQRDPYPHNGAAKELFASDLKAVASGKLSLAHEEKEKELLAIGEALGLRGGQIDELHSLSLAEMSKEALADSLEGVKKMTLTVIDGDFPRDVLSSKDLKFGEYKMPARRNTPDLYDAKEKGPAGKKEGVLKLGAIDWDRIDAQKAAAARTRGSSLAAVLASIALVLAGLAIVPRVRRRLHKAAAISVLLACAALLLGRAAVAQEDEEEPQPKRTIRQLLDDLSHKEKAEAAVAELVKRGEEAKEQLKGEAIEGNDLTRRGWAIVALGEIGGKDVDELLMKVHDDAKQPMLVRTWAAASRVSMVDTADELTALAPLAAQFPAVGRPIGMRLVEKLAGGEGASAEGLLSVSLKVPQLQTALAPAIMAAGADKLAVAMATAKDMDVRRQAAGYLATMALQGDKAVAGEVVKVYKFDPEAKVVAWNGGPLFVPGLQWEKENGRALAGNLIRWHLWCDRNSKPDEQRQIHNNIISLALAQAAGYQSPGFGDTTTVQWLQTWGKAVGKEELQALLKEQGVDEDAKYKAALEGL